MTGAANELPLDTIVLPSTHATSTSIPGAPHSTGGDGLRRNTSRSDPIVAATESTEENSAGYEALRTLAGAATTTMPACAA